MSVAVILTGGGARGAYQAGVLKGLAEILGRSAPLPGILAGISAGSINAIYCAARYHQFHEGVNDLCEMWSKLTASRIYESDFVSMSRIGLKFLSDASMGALYRKKMAHSLLDTAPLHQLLKDNINFDQVAENIRQGILKSICVTAYDYSEGRAVTFVHSQVPHAGWNKSRRAGRYEVIRPEHVMASSAIPILFPPIEIEGRYYADGNLRNLAPLSPAIQVGAEKLIIIGVRHAAENIVQRVPSGQKPSIARIFGLMLNSLFFDSTDADVERLRHVNSLVTSAQNPAYERQKVMEFLEIRPSKDLGLVAEEHLHHFPRTVRYLINGLGSKPEQSDLASYLLFESSYTQILVELGYKDCLNLRHEIEKMFA